MDDHQHYHTRNVYKLVDLVSEIGGLSNGLFAVISVVLGGYISYNSRIETMLNLYGNDDELYDKLRAFEKVASVKDIRKISK